MGFWEIFWRILFGDSGKPPRFFFFGCVFFFFAAFFCFLFCLFCLFFKGILGTLAFGYPPKKIEKHISSQFLLKNYKSVCFFCCAIFCVQ